MKVAQSCPTLCDPVDIYSPWNSPGKNTGVGSHSLLQGIFPTQGWNPGLLHCSCFFFFLLSQPPGKQWAITNSSRKNEAAGPKRKQCPVVDMCGGENNVQCYKEQLWRAPKSQLAVEQPLTGECWNPPETDTHLRRQRRSCSETVAGAQS